MITTVAQRIVSNRGWRSSARRRHLPHHRLVDCEGRSRIVVVIPSSHAIVVGVRYHSANHHRGDDRPPNPPSTPTPPPSPWLTPSSLLATVSDIWPLPVIRLFKKGLSRLTRDVLRSLHIEESNLTRLRLRHVAIRDRERRRARLRSREVHGIEIVDEEGRSLKFIPSASRRALPTTKKSQQHQRGSCSRSDRRRKEAKTAVVVDYLSARRPQEHLRQISRDLRTTLPTVAAFVLIPGVGYSFLLLGMMFPRLLLSRQFHTAEQRREFAETEHGSRRAWHEGTNDAFWGSLLRREPGLVFGSTGGEEEEGRQRRRGLEFNDVDDDDAPPLFLEPLSCLGTDAAGPVFDGRSMRRLYRLFRHVAGGSSSSIETLQTAHLHTLALSNNLAAPLYLPSGVAPLFLQTCLPDVYLQRKLRTLAEDIIVDDAALIEEGQSNTGCDGMTGEEVLDACWLRGLPPGRFARANDAADRGGNNIGAESEVDVMRGVLTHHLQLVEAVMRVPSSSKTAGGGLRPKGELVRDDTLQMLILHLPAIRHGMMLTHSKKGLSRS